MAGKSNKNKNKSKTAANPSEQQTEDLVDNNAAPVMENSDAVASSDSSNEKEDCSVSTGNCPEPEDGAKQNAETANATSETEAIAKSDGSASVSTESDAKPDSSTNLETAADGQKQSESELKLYPLSVKGPAGEKVELQVTSVDTVMDFRQFLLDAPETCFYTTYDLILTASDGSKHQLADYYEIGDFADVTTGLCSLEMVNALYDDRSVRTHLRRTRDLLSSTNVHSSFSTILAMENESKNQSGSGSKSEAPELEGLGFMEDPTSQLGSLVDLPSQPEIKCVESIAFSSFNPVPGYRRLVGDLIYLDIQTLEGKNYCVTAHTRGFFVNASSGSVLDPRPAQPLREASTLVALLRILSDKFSKGFVEVLERKAQGHPFENVPSLLPVNPWLGRYPPPVHRRDIARAEDSLMPSYGTETVGIQRDWNEELQSCREFPRKTLQDRIMRDRALYKVNCDFVDAATRGAKAVIGRCIPPINPADPERFHMYVHNNIFFSFAMDGDFMLMQQLHEQGSNKNSSTDEKKQDTANIEENANAEQSDKNQNDGTTAAEEESVSQVIENEQATYASANNDLQGTKAYNNADIAGLYTLAMAIIDYRGHRIVAQSIIPGILQGDKSDSLLYGSVDNGKKIFWNEKFHSKVLDAGKLLHIKEHEVVDGSGSVVKIAAPVECKGIVGSDERYYILDLIRTTPRDANYVGQGFKHAVLRPELVAAFCQAEALSKVKEKLAEKDEGEDKSLIQEEVLSIRLNPNVLTDFKLAGDPQEIAEDEETVKRAGKYLVETVLPKFVDDLSSLEVSPMDGQTLTEALHAHGINMRYLGHVANLSKQLPHIWDLCVVEMVTRTAKHVLKGILRATQDHDVAGAVAHFLNCYLGHDVSVNVEKATESAKTSGKPGSAENSPDLSGTSKSSGKSSEKSRKKGKGNKKSTEAVTSGELISSKTASYMCITPSLVWKDIQEGVKFKYQFELPDDVQSKVRKISTIRNLCQKVGITIAARSYDLNGPKTFQESDILDLNSVVKHSVPMCADARDLLESGKLKLAQGKLNEAYDLFNEGFSILQQVCGPMHREVANCCRYLAMVLYHAGDMAGAIMQQHKELIINERCLGLDHPDTAHSYGNMSLFYHGLNQTELALRHMARTLLLLNVSSGADHPDVAATFINIAMMYQDIGNMNVALRYLQEALQKNLRLLGEDHIQTAVCYHALAIAFNCIGAFKLSLQHERSTYNILKKQLGEDDSRTRDSLNWLKTFEHRCEMQKGQQQTISAAAAQKAADVLKARPDLLQVLASGGSGSRASFSKAAAAAAALMGDRENLPRSRGMDERGARAKADVRKRAAARGLNPRSQTIPVQALPELLNVPTNTVHGKPRVDDASTSTKVTEKAVSGGTEASGKKPEPVVDNGHDKSAAGQAPLGLGGGLGLEPKKPKPKSKPSKSVES